MKNIKLNTKVFPGVEKVNLPTDTGARGQFIDESDVPKVQTNKTVSDPITANGEHTFSKDSQYDGMASITINVNVPTDGDVEANHAETKNIVNGTAFDVFPSSGYSSMQKATITPRVSTEEKTVAPKTTSQIVTPPTNKLLSKVTVDAVDKTIDANIKAENIKKDVQILGETGTYEGEGGGGPEMLEWFEEFDWTPDTSIAGAHTFDFGDHGELPNFLYIYTDKKAPTTNKAIGGCLLFTCPSDYNWAATTWSGNMFYRQSTNQWYKTSPTSTTGITSVTNTTIEMTPNTYAGTICSWIAGYTYHVLVGRFANAEV